MSDESHINVKLQEVINNAIAGNADAQFALAVVLARGIGVKQDKEEAVKWHLLAAKQGHAEAQFILGLIYKKGEGTAIDNKEALKWLRLSAEQGNSQAQYNLGCWYQNSEIVAPDMNEAIKWYRLAAEQNHIQAQLRLGVYYGQTINYAESIKWFKSAAESGDCDAMYMLGVYYYNGDGVLKDKKLAKKLWHDAAKAGHKKAESMLTIIENAKDGNNNTGVDMINPLLDFASEVLSTL